MRFAAYTGTSVVLATGVLIRALHERANFYSACVYLAQSNACLMVLTNIALLGVCTGMLGLQRVFYGSLRPIEVEQLYEKAWFAITETCLAMTIFREEVGGWFLVMFVCLLIGKVWGWIGEGRVEILEQQPPPNPRIFHIRLSVSLLISALFDTNMLRYSIVTVLSHARPNMMVMFAFEFAVLTVTSFAAMARYSISLYEASIIHAQTDQRRAQIREERGSNHPASAATDNALPQENGTRGRRDFDDVDALDIDVPGWEEKGRWVFYLDLATDFLKLVLYITFFCVLCMFYGMPIHIIRDVALTIRSFYKRITIFVRYRQATRDMNAKYPDASDDDVAREDVCIICREDMRPWQRRTSGTNQQEGHSNYNRTLSNANDERLRPKKLPCGHILHFACLRSWLERQQNCPTCRRPVLVTGTAAASREQAIANQHDVVHPQPNRALQPVPPQAHEDLQQRFVAQNVFNLGPFRLAFGARQVVQGPPQQLNYGPIATIQQGRLPEPLHGQIPAHANVFGNQHPTFGLQPRGFASSSTNNVHHQLRQVEQQLNMEISALRTQQNQLYLVRALQGELARLRIAHASPDVALNSQMSSGNQARTAELMSLTAGLNHNYATDPQQQTMGTGHPNLPPGLSLPPGWTILPLQRVLDPGREISDSETGGNILRTSSQPQEDGPVPRSTISTSVNPELTGSTQRIKQTSPDTSLTARKVTSSSLTTNINRHLPLTASGDPPSITQDHHSAEAANEATQAYLEEPSERLENLTASQNSQDILPWGSASRSQIPNDRSENSTSQTLQIADHDDPPENSRRIVRTSTDSRQIKGKGKATSVEDVAEEAD